MAQKYKYMKVPTPAVQWKCLGTFASSDVSPIQEKNMTQ